MEPDLSSRLVNLDVSLRLLKVTQQVRHAQQHKRAKVSQCHPPINLAKEKKSFRELAVRLQRRKCQLRYSLEDLARKLSDLAQPYQ